ncbi:MAG: aldehyde ferredoxin oxidoreductase C-terminal domain-containing protein [Candidatus Bathyarchaeia archaeon]|jgi:aldehyde:ferredoxin oxidoreductase
MRVGAADHASMKRKVMQYYEQAGWDQKGIPTQETLTKLKLNYVNESLSRLRG